MKYIKAQDVLPEEIIELIQEYVDGEFMYIPRKNGGHKAWGEASGTRESLLERNRKIYRDYRSGTSVPDLTKLYYLSEQSIRRIISQEKQKCSNSLHNHL
ncbi:Mor transcription activator family protein [Ruminiclostridium hungatei]|uniref:Mor transcription activator family protein n=1 Tax=Ruminiclostridium hungatei TaxID=48256 RepID=A0A1V4SDX5_RUMHU|nr:CD3324 family protein [Ruminiclostridium hungatei]OPX42122.1 Mor transcription activator family protein [Ruminiclostridium hungatei]